MTEKFELAPTVLAADEPTGDWMTNECSVSWSEPVTDTEGDDDLAVLQSMSSADDDWDWLVQSSVDTLFSSSVAGGMFTRDLKTKKNEREFRISIGNHHPSFRWRYGRTIEDDLINSYMHKGADRQLTSDSRSKRIELQHWERSMSPEKTIIIIYTVYPSKPTSKS